MSRRIQWARFGIRFLIILSAIVVAILAQYRIAVARGEFQGSGSLTGSSAAHAILNTVDAALIGEASEEMDESELLQRREFVAGAASKIRGNTWSLDFLGTSLTDPLAGLEAIAASKNIVPAILIGIAIPICIALIFGRVFCSWICPAGLLFELGDWVREKFHPKSEKQPRLRVWRGSKYALLGFGLLMSAIVGIPLLGAIYPPALMMREIHFSIGSFFRGFWQDDFLAGALVISGSTLFLLGLVLVEIFVAPRFWCRAVCPGGALQSLLGKFRLVRVKNDFSACTKCAACVKACPMQLDPMSKDLGMECDSCMLCLPVCEAQSLSLSFSDFSKEAKKGGSS